MKKILFIIFILSATGHAFAQTNEATVLTDLSAKIFQWEVAGTIDSLNNAFHDKLQVWGTSGDPVNKTQYLQRLSSPDFVHNKVTVEKSVALIANNTAIVNGDGVFDLTVGGKKLNLHLSYTEVFTRQDVSKPWLLLQITAKTKGE